MPLGSNDHVRVELLPPSGLVWLVHLARHYAGTREVPGILVEVALAGLQVALTSTGPDRRILVELRKA